MLAIQGVKRTVDFKSRAFAGYNVALSAIPNKKNVRQDWQDLSCEFL